MGINTGFIYIPEGWKVNWFIFARLSEPLKKHPSPSACHRQFDTSDSLRFTSMNLEIPLGGILTSESSRIGLSIPNHLPCHFLLGDSQSRSEVGSKEKTVGRGGSTESGFATMLGDLLILSK